MGKSLIQFKSIPLRLLLIVPFLVQIFAIVGLIAGLSYRMGRSAIQDLALQLQEETSDRIHQELNYFLEIPHKINQLNTNAMDSGLLNLQDSSI